MSDALLWLVPCRRAVVRATSSYRALLDAWVAALTEARSAAAMQRWYSLDAERYEASVQEVSAWETTFFPRGPQLRASDVFAIPLSLDAVRDGAITVDTRPHFKVRLWKGPQRVLREASQRADAPAEPEPTVYDPLETESPRLRLSPRREVDNPDAMFLMGDVVEFPVWKLVALCGRTEFGNAPAYSDALRFNPRGSYLLGTSVTGSDDKAPPPTLALHDNLLAMRFQVLLGCYVGSFYHHEPVFLGRADAVSAPVDDARFTPAPPPAAGAATTAATVYARGMVYAATLHCAGHRDVLPSYVNRQRARDRAKERERDRAKDHPKDHAKDAPPASPAAPNAWHFFTNAWCRSGKGGLPVDLPTSEGLKSLPTGQPVTPGSVCSDTALFLLNYMIRNHGKSRTSTWGKGSVGGSMRPKYKEGAEHIAYTIHDYFDRWPAKDIKAVVPTVEQALRLERFDATLKAVRDLYDRVSGVTSFWHVDVALAHLTIQRWSNVGAKRYASLQGAAKVGPKTFFDALNAALCRTKDLEREALTALHDRVMADRRAFYADLEALIASENWAVFASDGPTLAALIPQPPSLQIVAAVGFAFAPSMKLPHAKMIGAHLSDVASALGQKRQHLERLGAHRERIKEVCGGPLDMSPHLSAVNTVSLSAHEWSIVRLRDFSALLEEPSRPQAGFIAAFHPLSGASYFEAPTATAVQHYVFEESASLNYWKDTTTGRAHTTLGAAPFRWRAMEGNEFMFRVANESLLVTAAGKDYSSQPLMSITRLLDDALLATPPKGVPDESLPILVHPTTTPTDPARHAAFDAAYARMVVHGEAMYAARALPFPTLDESRGAFADHDEAQAHVDEAQRRIDDKRWITAP